MAPAQIRPWRVLVVCVLALVAVLAGEGPARAPADASDPTTLVDPMIGTRDHGNTFPGAALPFGMVQPSPDTGATAGYDYDDRRIDGFSQTHLSGVGCGAEGEVPVMPTTGAVTTDRAGYAARYDHGREVARPGYYAVDLDTGVRAELTATARTAWHRYTFPATGEANVLFDVGRALMPVYGSHVEVVGDRTVEGWVEAGHFCHDTSDRHRVYFTARFDRPFASYGTWTGADRSARSRTATGNGSDAGAWVTFDARSARTVGLTVGLSYTGMDGARANLAAESAGQSFDRVASAAHDRWATALRAAQVSGGRLPARVAFTTALYHALLHPNVAGDVDGSYAGADGAVHRATDHTPMANFSLWDTFRTQNQLLALLEPDVGRDVALSVLAIAREGGWLPRWSLAGSETNVMTGDPVTPFLVEDWSKGLLAGHEDEAYAALRRNAMAQPPAGSPFNGRSGNAYYRRSGYIPSRVRCPARRGDGDCARPASATLEYAAADAALAGMARALGHRADARALTARAQDYRRLWDPGLRTFRPRTADGQFLSPYDPSTGSGQFHEGGAYQYRWLVPQDPAGLIRLLGGRAAAIRDLDGFFSYRALLRDPAGTARGTWVADAYEYYGTGYYNPNNEPDLHAPYIYAWTGQPWKTATVVRAAETLFTTGPEGMTGNDDLGTMSAWYVLSSLGLYPTMSGSGTYVLTTPQFPHAVVRLGRVPGRQGGALQIDAPGVGDATRYVASARLRGRNHPRPWVRHAAIARGGRLAYAVAARPTSWGTRPGDAPPPGG